MEKLDELTNKLDQINRRIEHLEATETNMLHQLQRSITEHSAKLSINTFNDKVEPILVS